MNQFEKYQILCQPSYADLGEHNLTSADIWRA